MQTQEPILHSLEPSPTYRLDYKYMSERLSLVTIRPALWVSVWSEVTDYHFVTLYRGCVHPQKNQQLLPAVPISRLSMYSIFQVTEDGDPSIIISVFRKHGSLIKSPGDSLGRS